MVGGGGVDRRRRGGCAGGGGAGLDVVLAEGQEVVPVVDRPSWGRSLGQADDDVAARQDVLGVLQQGDEGLLGADAQLLGGHEDVEPLPVQDGLPAGDEEVRGVVARRLGAASAVPGRTLDRQRRARRLLHPEHESQGGSLGVQPIADGVRGIPRFSHSSALYKFAHMYVYIYIKK